MAENKQLYHKTFSIEKLKEKDFCSILVLLSSPSQHYHCSLRAHSHQLQVTSLPVPPVSPTKHKPYLILPSMQT
jgi:hypothetical protein